MPCTGGRTTSQEPTLDVLLYVRTGRRVLSDDEQAAFISSNRFKLWFQCPRAFHSVFARNQTYYCYFCLAVTWSHSSSTVVLDVALSKDDNQSRGHAAVHKTPKVLTCGRMKRAYNSFSFLSIFFLTFYLTIVPPTCILLGRRKGDEMNEGEW